MTTVGIDLGTTNSAVAVVENGLPRVITNPANGSPLTPSAIWEDPSGEIQVGHIAYGKAGSALRFKRLMGSNETVRLGGRELTPEQCSGLLLKHLRKYAEDNLQTSVDSAVITVPANWKDAARRATERAARLVGIPVARLINEPTAAAMAYGMRDDADGKTIAVYDLGGGTFDITILRIQDRVFDIVTSVGDERLGGVDFDEALFSVVMERVKQREGYTLPPEEQRDGKLQQRVRELALVCEEAKHELSFTSHSTIDLPFLALHDARPLGIEEALSRQGFERIIGEAVGRTVDYMASALRRAQLPKETIDEIVLVGGSSRIPLVRQRVAEFFGKEPLTSAVNPDEAVALGAAIQAGIIAQPEITEDAFVALDVTNSSLGVEVATVVGGKLVPGVFSAIIPKDERLPAEKTESYSTIVDGQTTILVSCYQGEHPVAAENEFIGFPIRVDGLPRRPAGEHKIDVTFTLGISGTLDIAVEIEGTDLRESQRFSLNTSGEDEAELEERRAQIEALWSQSALAARFKTLIARAEQLLREEGDFTERAELERAVVDLKRSIAEGDEAKAEELDLRLTDILFDLE